MAKRDIAGNLYDPRRGDQAIRTQSLRLDRKPSDPARTNYFAIYFIESGSGAFWTDASKFAFGPDSLLFFVPYQQIRFVPDSPVQGEVIQFHANFLCVETFHAEVGCSGILFNDPYGITVVQLDERAKPEAANLIERIRKDQAENGLAHGEAMLACLKVLLILATRLKAPYVDACGPGTIDLRQSGPRPTPRFDRAELPHPAFARRMRQAAPHDGEDARQDCSGTLGDHADRSDPYLPSPDQRLLFAPPPAEPAAAEDAAADAGDEEPLPARSARPRGRGKKFVFPKGLPHRREEYPLPP